MYTIRKKFKFEASHVLDEAFSKDCLNIHGHSYYLEIIISTKELNSDGMVVDFGELKKHVEPLIKKLDHACIISNTNSKMKRVLRENNYKNYVMEGNPTAENMCKMIYDILIRSLFFIFCFSYLTLKIRLHETETGYAEYTEE